MRPTYEKPLLNKKQEHHLFRLYNYLKYRANKYIKHREHKKAKPFLDKAILIRNQLATSNFRLVCSVIKPNEFLEDCYSEAYLGLFRIIDRFDYRRGIKFSTYCVWSLKSIISRFLYNTKRHISDYVDGTDLDIVETPSNYECESNVDTIRQNIHKLLQSIKDARTKDIIKKRNGIDCEEMTYTAIGNQYKVCKERIRQIQNVTYEKLREKINPELLEFVS